MQALESFDNLSLFQSSHRFNSSPVLDKAISLLNHMIELDYIAYGANGFELTNSGIKYMINQWEKDQQMVESSKNFSFAYALNGTDPNNKKSGHRIIQDFQSSNLLFAEDDEADYNNMVFNREYDSNEPGVDGIEKI